MIYSPLLPLPFCMPQQYPKSDPNHPLKPYLAMAYTRRLQIAAHQSLRLDTNTLVHSVEAFLEAMLGTFTLPSDGILHFPESDAHTQTTGNVGPLERYVPSILGPVWDPR